MVNLLTKALTTEHNEASQAHILAEIGQLRQANKILKQKIANSQQLLLLLKINPNGASQKSEKE